MFLGLKLVLLAIVALIACSNCSASSGSNQERQRELEQIESFSSEEGDALQREADIADLLQQYVDDELQDVPPPSPSSPSSESAAYFSETPVDVIGPKKQLDKKSSLARAVNMVCPKEATRPDKSGPGVELHFYIPNKPKAIIMREVRSDMWRRKDVDRLVANGFNVNKPTLIYLGGWLQNIKSAYWLQTARKNFDKLAADNGGEAPYNLLIFDWGNYSFINFGRSAALVPYLGELLANLLEQLIDRHKLKAELLHLISYSLSAHIAGIGARLVKESGRGVVDQITAIDATGVCFHQNGNDIFDNEYGLRPTDAKLVVARHYNMHGLGSSRPIGGLDILVNGGKQQPAMKVQRTNLKDVFGSYAWPVSGSHHRATQHEEAPFTLNSDCHEIAYECPDKSKFKMGQCAKCGQQNESCFLVSTLGNIMLDQRPANVGYKPGTQMHITTGVAQFCVYHYQVVAKLKPKPTRRALEAFAEGKFKLELAPKVVAKPKYRLDDEDGVKFTHLLRLSGKINRFPETIDLRKLDIELLDSLESVSIKFMSHISAKERARSSFRYCPDKSGKQLLTNCRKTLGKLFQQE